MACTKDKFIINKNVVNEFLLTIKQDGTTLPLAIDPSDTFTLKLLKLSDNSLIATVTLVEDINVGVIEVIDATSGKLTVKLYQALTNTLESRLGDRADNYYENPVYRIVIECSTVGNGNFLAKIPLVYVR